LGLIRDDESEGMDFQDDLKRREKKSWKRSRRVNHKNIRIFEDEIIINMNGQWCTFHVRHWKATAFGSGNLLGSEDKCRNTKKSRAIIYPEQARS